MATRNADDEEVVVINGAEGGRVRAKARDAEADDDDDLDIVDDTPEKDKGRQPLNREVKDPDDEELATYSAGVKNRIAEITHARHDERRARESAERERDEAVRASQALLLQNRQLANRTNAGETHLLAATKAGIEAELETARREVKAAKEEFDSDAEMAANEKLLEAKIKLRELERYRPQPVQVQEDVVQLPAVKAQDDPVDQKTLRWQAKNQWFGTDGNEEMTALALAVHKRLVGAGVDPRSDEYFAKVDARLHEKFPEFFGEEVDTSDTRSQQRTPPRSSPVAPVSRTTSGATKVRLTQTQLTLARRLGVTPQQYAQEVVRLEQK